MWPFRRHKPEHAPAVQEAREKRDELLDQADAAIQEVDRLQDRLTADYEAAENDRRGKR